MPPSHSVPLLAFPLWKTRRIAPSHDRCFIIMPFKDPWLRRLYSRHISAVLRQVGLDPQHAGQRHGPVITEDIWIALNEARVVLAELTGSNPNVMYELGIAHTLGKPVILLTSKPATRIPFDLKVLRHIIYKRTPREVYNLKSALRSELEVMLNEHPSGHLLIAETEATAAAWATGYRDASLSCTTDDLNRLRLFTNGEHLSDRAISYCAASACYFNSLGNMMFWGSLCSKRSAAAQDLVFALFSQHARTRIRVAHLLSLMSPTTASQIALRMLEYEVDPQLAAAIREQSVLRLVEREYASLHLTLARRDQLLHELERVRW